MGFTERLPEVTGYALEKVLGRDGTATVYAGRQVALDRPCALKVLDPEVATDKDAVKRFLREAKLAAKLHHENVVALNDVGTDTKSGLHYIALELVDGPSLRRHLAIQGGLPEAEAVRIALGVARALEAAERSRIVHRDVRPGKILLTSRGVPKLAGLGLGRLRDLRGQTVVGTRRLGSPLFVAPEIIDGGEVDSRADLYSLGIVLFRMLTGDLPYAGAPGGTNRLVKLRDEGLPPIEGFDAPISDETCAVVARLCAWNAADRFRTARTAVVALEALAPPEPSQGMTGDASKFLLDTPARGHNTRILIEVAVEIDGERTETRTFTKKRVVIGSDPKADLRIEDPPLAPRHAELICRAGRPWLIDLAGRDDVRLEGDVVEESVFLEQSDVVAVGGERCRIHVNWRKAETSRSKRASRETARAQPAKPVPNEGAPTRKIGAAALQEIRAPGPAAGGGAAVAPQPATSSPAPTGDTPSSFPTRRTRKPPSAGAVASRAATPRPPEPRPAQPEPSEPAAEAPLRGWLTFDGLPNVAFAVERVLQLGSDEGCEIALARGAPRKAAVIVSIDPDHLLLNVSDDPAAVRHNGEVVRDRALLTDGDLVTVCGVKLRFVLADGAPR